MYIPREGWDFTSNGAGHRRCHVAGGGLGYGDLGLAKPADHAVGHAKLIEPSRRDVVRDLGQARGERRGQAGLVDRQDGLGARLGGDVGERTEAMIEREQLAIVGAGARQIELGGALVDQLVTRQGRRHRGACLGFRLRRVPGWGRRHGLGRAGDSAIETASTAGAEEAQQKGLVLTGDLHGGSRADEAPLPQPIRWRA